MHPGAITQHIDVAEVLLFAFGVFFVLLVIYLHREGKREGYPLVATGKVPGRNTGLFGMPSPKTFLLHDGTTRSFPNGGHDPFPVNASKRGNDDGDPLTPNGDPMTAQVGPGAYAMRADVPDMTHHGEVKIVPMRSAPGFFIPSEDKSPVGLPVVGGDGRIAGKISDVWVDRAEIVIRYLEVEIAGGTQHVLLPMNFANVTGRNVQVHAIYASQFAHVPGVKTPGRITFLEEERVMAYYGAGKLYAHPSRAEPLL